MKVFQDIWLSFLGILITITFQFIVLAGTNPHEVDTNPNQLFKVQGDLWVAALAVALSAFSMAATDKQRGNLVRGFITLLLTFIAITAITLMSGLSFEWVKHTGEWLSIWIPDGISALTLLFCIYVARGMHK